MPVLSAFADAASVEAAPHPGDGRVARLVKLGEWLLVLALVAYAGAKALPHSWSHLNTDFPNYYVTSRLLREGSRTSRIYEWIWLQRQKDRMGIATSDQPLVGFIPHTPFSGLLVWPLTSFSPLAAKQIWIVLNIALLAVVAAALRSITRLPWRHLALLIGLCYPVLRNLQYGQYYVVLLALITLALWCYLRDQYYGAGILVGIAGGLKIFPAFFLLYFLRKRNLPAALGLALGVGFTLAASLLAFGLELHRTYLFQVLPWALRGEAVDPYNLAANSPSSLLHRLFIFEPQWNPHPLVHAPAAFAVLHPLLQMAVLAPVILLMRPGSCDRDQVRLEWSCLLLALLAISTVPASYHFTLLLLPVAVMAATFLRRKQYPELVLLSLLYLSICFPAWPRGNEDGWWALLAVPRLYFLLLFVILSYVALTRETGDIPDNPFERQAWAAALFALLIFQIASTLLHQRGLYNYDWRIPARSAEFLATNPAVSHGAVNFVAMSLGGYAVRSIGTSAPSLSSSAMDLLSISSAGDGLWIEEAAMQSRIVQRRPNRAIHTEIDDAGVPVASPDGNSLAYLRFTKGAGALWLRSLSYTGQPDALLTPSYFDVEEMTFLPNGSLVLSAMENHGRSRLYQASPTGDIRAIASTESRYPAASPDGRWLAYSQLDDSVYHLWLRDLRDGTTHQLTTAQCNSISPAWEADSKTLLYASDCGRALGFTALYRRQVIR